MLVVDGSITNQPGPYTIYLTRASSLINDLDVRIPVRRATLVLHSDAGEQESLAEVTPGKYQTNTIQGVPGRSYWIQIALEDGTRYESNREKLNPPGEITSLSSRFQQDNVLERGTEVRADRFDLLVDATGFSTTENYMRWRTTGTYAIRTYPHLMTAVTPDGIVVPAPPPCSGYVFRNGALRQVDDCTCCDCWVTTYERLPYISDDQLIRGGTFKNVNIGAIPINRRTFYERYHVSVEQISLTMEAFEYFRLIKAQKEGAASLFQPPSAKLRGNVRREGTQELAQGFFWAGSITTKTLFIDKSVVPYSLPPIDTVKAECFQVRNAVATKPGFWR